MRGVAVVGRRPHLHQVERPDRAQLVGGQRLGRREVERGGLLVLEQRGQDRQQVGQRLAGRRAGRDDDGLAAAGEVGGLRLMLPGRRHAQVLEPVHQQLRAPSLASRPGGRSGPGRARRG